MGQYLEGPPQATEDGLRDYPGLRTTRTFRCPRLPVSLPRSASIVGLGFIIQVLPGAPVGRVMIEKIRSLAPGGGPLDANSTPGCEPRYICDIGPRSKVY